MDKEKNWWIHPKKKKHPQTTNNLGKIWTKAFAKLASAFEAISCEAGIFWNFISVSYIFDYFYTKLLR